MGRKADFRGPWCTLSPGLFAPMDYEKLRGIGRVRPAPRIDLFFPIFVFEARLWHVKALACAHTRSFAVELASWRGIGAHAIYSDDIEMLGQPPSGRGEDYCHFGASVLSIQPFVCRFGAMCLRSVSKNRASPPMFIHNTGFGYSAVRFEPVLLQV